MYVVRYARDGILWLWAGCERMAAAVHESPWPGGPRRVDPPAVPRQVLPALRFGPSGAGEYEGVPDAARPHVAAYWSTGGGGVGGPDTTWDRAEVVPLAGWESLLGMIRGVLAGCPAYALLDALRDSGAVPAEWLDAVGAEPAEG